MFFQTKRFQKHVSVWIVVFAFLVSLLPTSAMGARGTLYAVLVADTGDFFIGTSVQQDLGKIEWLVREIAQCIGFVLQLKVLSGSDATKSNVMDAVRSISPGPEDVIIFYYSGHGENSYGVWPDMNLNKASPSLAFGEVIDHLKSKGARFVLGLADCCNEYTEPPNVPPVPRPIIEEESYRKLFLYQSGYIFACSSQPGELSCTSQDGGSMFTNDFLAQLYDELSSSDPSWHNISPRELSCNPVQHPHYEKRLKQVSSPGDDVTSCSIALTTIDPRTERDNNSFCIGDPIDVKLTNSCGEMKSVSVINRDTRGSEYRLYSGSLEPGTSSLSLLKNTSFTVEGPAGTEIIRVDVNESGVQGEQISFEVRDCW